MTRRPSGGARLAVVLLEPHTQKARLDKVVREPEEVMLLERKLCIGAYDYKTKPCAVSKM